MRATELQELEAMAANLLATARELPAGPDRRSIFKEIEKFRTRIIALQRDGLDSTCANEGEGK